MRYTSISSLSKPQVRRENILSLLALGYREKSQTSSQRLRNSLSLFRLIMKSSPSKEPGVRTHSVVTR